MTEELTEIREKMDALLTRLGKSYDGASHPKILVATHRDAIFEGIFPLWANANGWVKLAENQSLPRNKMSMASKLLYATAHEAQQDMLKEGWRKVIKLRLSLKIEDNSR